MSRRYLRAAFGRDHDLRPQINLPKSRLGTLYGGWWVCDSVLGRTSKPSVLSFGIGCDISFDIEMIKRFGAEVYAFDPTPKCLSWLDAQLNLPPQFNAFPLGLSNFDGEQEFAPPSRPEWDDYSSARSSKDYVRLPVRKLSTIVQELVLDAIDVMKMDIEGSEYGVIDDLVSSPIRPAQLLVEFHYDRRHSDVLLVKNSVQQLKDHQYLIFDVSPWGREISFIHQSALIDR